MDLTELEQQLRKSNTLKVMVPEREHANCDSLPLRFGVYFSKDTTVELSSVRFLYPDRQYSDRFHINAQIANSKGDSISGHFVVSARPGLSEPVLVTVWRHDVDTEYRLSEIMISLRRKGIIDPHDLLNLHPLYVNGKVSNAAELVEQLALLLSDERVALMKDEAIAANKRADEAITALHAAIKRAEHAESVALEASYVVDDLESQNQNLNTRVNELEVELERYKEEQKVAAVNGSEATLSKPDLLVEVRENQLFKGSLCTILLLSDGTQRHMKTSTFDKTGDVTAKAKELVGRRVRTTCWDPIGQPGKWSRQGYFRNIYEVEQLDFTPPDLVVKPAAIEARMNFLNSHNSKTE